MAQEFDLMLGSIPAAPAAPAAATASAAPKEPAAAPAELALGGFEQAEQLFGIKIALDQGRTIGIAPL